MSLSEIPSTMEIPVPAGGATPLEEPKISVLTAVLNAERTVGEALESVLSQSYRNWEVLVMDGGSRDRTVAVAESFRDPRISVRSEPDEGLFDAMNKAIAWSTGDALGFLNADDRFHDVGALAAIAGTLSTHDVVHGHLDFIDGDKVVRRWRATPYTSGAFSRGWMPAHPTVYMRRWVVERTGDYDNGMRIAADYDYLVRSIELLPVSVGLVDRVLIDMRVGGRSTAGPAAYLTANIESLRSRQRWLGSGPVDLALFLKPARKILQWL